jgi:hypothetical protein
MNEITKVKLIYAGLEFYIAALCVGYASITGFTPILLVAFVAVVLGLIILMD